MKLRNILVISVLVILVALFALSYTGVIRTGFVDLRSHMEFLPLVVALAAFLDSLNPCAFSVLFLTMAFLFSVGHNRRHIIKAGLAYVFGIFLTYVLIGLGTLKALTLFNITNGPAKIGAVAIIIFAVIMIINEFFPKFPIKLKIPEATHERLGGLISKASVPSAFILGFLVGMFEFPCAGGPYLFVLGMIHENSTHYVGIAYLLFYNLIFVLPLLIALFVVSDKVILEKLDKLRRAKTKQVRIWTAIIFILLGLMVFVI
jgi:cytochrome c biogenesis protein CcdA